MPNIFGKLIDRYPRLPALLANTSASKLIQLIKDKAIDPILGQEQAIHKIQSWSTPVKKTAEWALYLLSGTVRTMPEPGHPVAIMLQEALAESLTQVGIKINEISNTERMEIIVSTLPIIRGELIGAAGKDHSFRDRMDTIIGTAHDWDKLIDEADNYVSHISQKTQAHRAARKARGWRRFV